MVEGFLVVGFVVAFFVVEAFFVVAAFVVAGDFVVCLLAAFVALPEALEPFVSLEAEPELLFFVPLEACAPEFVPFTELVPALAVVALLVPAVLLFVFGIANVGSEAGLSALPDVT